MGVLEEISSMKSQGLSENEIILELREKGTSPKEIQDAISQLKIKNAISDYAEEEKNIFKEQGEILPPKAQEFQEQEPYPQPSQNYNSSPQGYSPDEAYAPQQGYSGGMDANVLIEISEQVFSEKIKPIQKDLDTLNESKVMNQIRLENLNDRLKRMETMFDKLQITILEKIGSYGQNLDSIKKEMEMVQNSFTKIADPLVDRAEKIYEKKRQTSSKKR